MKEMQESILVRITDTSRRTSYWYQDHVGKVLEVIKLGAEYVDFGGRSISPLDCVIIEPDYSDFSPDSSDDLLKNIRKKATQCGHTEALWDWVNRLARVDVREKPQPFFITFTDSGEPVTIENEPDYSDFSPEAIEDFTRGCVLGVPYKTHGKNSSKPPLSLVPEFFVEAVARGFEKGLKNGREVNDWMLLHWDDETSRTYCDALLRHAHAAVTTLNEKEFDVAKEHLAAVATNAYILMFHEVIKRGH